MQNISRKPMTEKRALRFARKNARGLIGQRIRTGPKGQQMGAIDRHPGNPRLAEITHNSGGTNVRGKCNRMNREQRISAAHQLESEVKQFHQAVEVL